jgi:hypothetical protein
MTDLSVECPLKEIWSTFMGTDVSIPVKITQIAVHVTNRFFCKTPLTLDKLKLRDESKTSYLDEYCVCTKNMYGTA